MQHCLVGATTILQYLRVCIAEPLYVILRGNQLARALTCYLSLTRHHHCNKYLRDTREAKHVLLEESYPPSSIHSFLRSPSHTHR